MIGCDVTWVGARLEGNNREEQLDDQGSLPLPAALGAEVGWNGVSELFVVNQPINVPELEE